MTGGAGADRFDFNAVSEIGKGSTRDVIKDFSMRGGDRIDLWTIDANGSASGNGKFKFLAEEGGAFTGVKGQLHWAQLDYAGTGHDRTVIYGDISGDRKADFQIELTGLVKLDAGDFVL